MSRLGQEQTHLSCCKSSPGKEILPYEIQTLHWQGRTVAYKVFSPATSVCHTSDVPAKQGNCQPVCQRVDVLRGVQLTRQQRSGITALAQQGRGRSLHKYITFQNNPDIAEPLPYSFPPRSINNLPSFLKKELWGCITAFRANSRYSYSCLFSFVS